MAFEAKFSSFGKKKNSTAQNNGGTTQFIVLKDNTSLLNPVFELRSSGYSGGNSEESAITPTWDYCYVPIWNRYYFITDWSYNKGLWYCSCTSDVMATYKSAISNYTCFVERSAQNYDNMIADPYLTQKQEYQTITSNDYDMEGISLGGSFTYIISFAGDSSVGESNTGEILYAMTGYMLGTLLNYAFDPNNYNAPGGVAEYWTKAFFNPFDYIKSVKIFPINYNLIAGSSENVHIGWLASPVKGKRLSSHGTFASTTFPVIPKYYNDWRDNHPQFTKLDVFIPGYGEYNLPPEVYYKYNQLRIDTTIDYDTGGSINEVYCGNRLINTLLGQIGFPVAVSEINNNSHDILETVINGASAVLSGVTGNLGAAAQGVGNTIDSIGAAASPRVRSIGTSGGIMGIMTRPFFTITHYAFNSAEYPTSVLGRPLYKTVQLGSRKGYQKCAGASITVGAYDSEREMINNYLNTGFYMD